MTTSRNALVQVVAAEEYGLSPLLVREAQLRALKALAEEGKHEDIARWAAYWRDAVIEDYKRGPVHRMRREAARVTTRYWNRKKLRARIAYEYVRYNARTGRKKTLRELLGL